MADKLLTVADGFWNIRGSFRIGGVVQIGTQASLVRLSDGRFVLLDAYTLPDSLLAQVRAITGPQGVDALLNLHPFHTIHVRRAHAQFPEARLFGTARHVAQAPELPWQPLRTDDPALHAELAPELVFTVPAGVDFISDDPKVHFSSVLALHRPSKTIHVDDTLTYARLPLVGEHFAFHPTLASALEKRPGAAQAFRAWAETLAADWGDARNLCAAHLAPLLGTDDLGARIQRALARVSRTLDAHQKAHG